MKYNHSLKHETYCLKKITQKWSDEPNIVLRRTELELDIIIQIFDIKIIKDGEGCIVLVNYIWCLQCDIVCL
jgi:hypothetical protein